MLTLPRFLALSLAATALAPDLVSAAIFPDNTLVKMLDHKGFKAAMKENMTSLVAFVAPWCGHCQKMAPEYSKAALGLYPLIPLYAVDCDAAKNKRLCADQGIKGFPTVKMFPRGKDQPPVEFQGPERTASAFFYWASRGIPSKVTKIHQFEDIAGTVVKKDVIDKPRALLMNKSNKIPLLWLSLGNKYRDDIVFWSHRDRRGKSSVKLGFEAGDDKTPKVLIYPPGESKPVQFKGILKFDSLSKFFDSLLDGTADLSELNAAAEQETFTPDPEMLEIERQQEAEMLKLAHGGFADMIDFEQAVKDGSAKDFHGKNGYPGMMGSAPEVDAKYLKKDKENTATPKAEVPVSSSSSKKIRMPVTGDGGQIIVEVPTSTKGQPQTPVPRANAHEEEKTADKEQAAPEPEPEAEVPVSEDVVMKDEVVVDSDSAPEPEPENTPEAVDESPVEATPLSESAGETQAAHVKDEL